MSHESWNPIAILIPGPMSASGGGAVRKRTAGATPPAVARQGLLNPRDPATL